MDETPVRPDLIERLGALAHEMDASAEEMQAAACEWAEIEVPLPRLKRDRLGRASP